MSLLAKFSGDGTSLLGLKYNPGGADNADKWGLLKQPYIADIPEFLKSDFINGVDKATGGFIRGGVAGATSSSIIDSLRIGKFMVDPARGLPFIIKQQGLQLSNTDYAGKRSIEPSGGNILERAGNVLGGIIKSFDPKSNTAYGPGTPVVQAGINAFGGHLKRHGLIPKPSLGELDKSGYYYNELQNIDTQDPDNFSNRLVELKTKFNTIEDKVTLYNYTGGPNSVFGIGTTTIKSAGNNINNLGTRSRTFERYNFQTLLVDTNTLGDKPESITTDVKSYISLDKLKDFRSLKNQIITEEDRKLPETNYGVKGNMETRLGIGTKLEVRDGNSSYTVGDKLNTLPIIRTNDNVNSNANFLEKHSTRDLIRFFIEAVDTDNPSERDYIQFRAFLDGFGDSYGAKWDSYNFVGNPEQFFNYESFNRDVSLSFKLVALSEAELKPMYIRLNALISQLMPNYAKNNTKARGSYVKLTVGSYLDRVPGFITSLNIDWKTDYPWEINIDGKAEQVLPHMLDVSMKFQPIHNFIPQKVTPDNSDVPFITLNSRNGNSERIWLGEDNFKNA